MRLSTKGRYAVMALADMALNTKGRPVSLAEISERQQISLSYLEQLFARLRSAGLVKSTRGPGGGYSLSMPVSETYVADIILAVDEPIRATRCIQTSNRLGANKRLQPEQAKAELGCMPGGKRCLTHDLWEELGEAIQAYLSKVSLAEVIAPRRRVTAQFNESKPETVGN